MLVFIGLGLSVKHLTREALEYMELCDVFVIDNYTGLVEKVEELIEQIKDRGKIVILAKRSDLEGPSITRLVEEARTRNIAVLVPGDPFIATTHDAIRVEALKRGIEVRVVHGISIYSLAASRVGLQAYRFGKMITLVYPDYFKPYSVIETIYDNLERNLHTLILLDFRRDEERYMTIPEAVEILMDLDEKGILKKVIGVGVARLGFRDEYLVADKLPNLREKKYPPPPHSLIVVAKPHPIELDLLKHLCGLPEEIYLEYLNAKTYP